MLGAKKYSKNLGVLNMPTVSNIKKQRATKESQQN